MPFVLTNRKNEKEKKVTNLEQSRLNSQAAIFRGVDNAPHWINHYLVAWFGSTFCQHLSAGQRFILGIASSALEQLNPDVNNCVHLNVSFANVTRCHQQVLSRTIHTRFFRLHDRIKLVLLMLTLFLTAWKCFTIHARKQY